MWRRMLSRRLSREGLLCTSAWFPRRTRLGWTYTGAVHTLAPWSSLRVEFAPAPKEDLPKFQTGQAGTVRDARVPF